MNTLSGLDRSNDTVLVDKEDYDLAVAPFSVVRAVMLETRRRRTVGHGRAGGAAGSESGFAVLGLHLGVEDDAVTHLQPGRGQAGVSH